MHAGQRISWRRSAGTVCAGCRQCRSHPASLGAVGHWGTLDRWAQPVPPSAAMDHNTPHRVRRPTRDHYDVVIAGSGMGGGTMAYALKDSGLSVLLIERGDYLPQEPQNWDARAVFVDGRYKNAEPWYSVDGSSFLPGTYYYVGGNTKFYGGSLARFRREDFAATQHHDGVSPGWPFGYDDMAPFYSTAERVYRVHGEPDDPTLIRETPYPFPGIGHERDIQRAADRLTHLGYAPSTIPLGLDLRQGGSCIRCATCDGFPCRVLAKADADVCCIRPAVSSGAVELLTNARVERVRTDESGRHATGVEVDVEDRAIVIDAGVVVISCGAVNSAALLLRSANARHPQGLANSSGTVGRHYMVHNNSIMLGVNPFQRNRSVFQKTLYVNDYYLRGTSAHPYPARAYAAHRQAPRRDDQGAAPSCADLAARCDHSAQHRLVAVHRRPTRPGQQGHAATRRNDPDRVDSQQCARPRGVGAGGAQHRPPPGISARLHGADRDRSELSSGRHSARWRRSRDVGRSPRSAERTMSRTYTWSIRRSSRRFR